MKLLNVLKIIYLKVRKIAENNGCFFMYYYIATRVIEYT